MRRAKWLGALALMALLLARPEAAAQGALRAMAQWQSSVAPALFPFLALMPLLTGPEAAAAYEALLGRAMKALFDLPGGAAPALVAGMTAGSPAGAIAARNAAVQSGMSRGQLRRLATAVTGFSPAFLVGGVGAGLLGSAALGWKLFEAQLLTQLTLALLLRRAWRGQDQPVEDMPRRSGDQPVREAVMTALTVCGYMTLFGAANAALRSCVPAGAADALLCLTDVPSGAALVAGLSLPAGLPLPADVTPVLLAGMTGFGGTCLLAQNISALKGSDFGAGGYVAARVAAAALNAGYMWILMQWPAMDVEGFARQAMAQPAALAALLVSILTVPVLFKLKKTVF